MRALTLACLVLLVPTLCLAQTPAPVDVEWRKGDPLAGRFGFDKLDGVAVRRKRNPLAVRRQVVAGPFALTG